VGNKEYVFDYQRDTGSCVTAPNGSTTFSASVLLDYWATITTADGTFQDYGQARVEIAGSCPGEPNTTCTGTFTETFLTSTLQPTPPPPAAGDGDDDEEDDEDEEDDDDEED